MGILLVFDVTKEDSFKNITDWLRNIEKHTTGTINKLLLGNKCDLEDKRVVSKEQVPLALLQHVFHFNCAASAHRQFNSTLPPLPSL